MPKRTGTAWLAARSAKATANARNRLSPVRRQNYRKKRPIARKPRVNAPAA
jgi:hypothetical protein